MNHTEQNGIRRGGVVWVRCCDPVFCLGIAGILDKGFRVRCGERGFASTEPACIIQPLWRGGISELRRLCEENPGVPVMAFGLDEIGGFRTALRAGARGYLHTGLSPEGIRESVGAAVSGSIPVSGMRR